MTKSFEIWLNFNNDITLMTSVSELRMSNSLPYFIDYNRDK